MVFRNALRQYALVVGIIGSGASALTIPRRDGERKEDVDVCVYRDPYYHLNLPVGPGIALRKLSI